MSRRRRSLVGLKSLNPLPPVEDDEESTMTVLMTHIRDQLGEDDLTPAAAPRRAGRPSRHDEPIYEAVLVHQAMVVVQTPLPLDGSLRGPPPAIRRRPPPVWIAVAMALWTVGALVLSVLWTLWP